MLPPFVQWLIIANVVAFLAQGAVGAPLVEWFALWPGEPGAVLSAPWTLLTYGFLHAGVTHLLFNMFALWMFGSDVERVFGPPSARPASTPRPATDRSFRTREIDRRQAQRADLLPSARHATRRFFL